MAKANITQYSSTPSSNTDINNINIDENCPASGLNNAIRELMAHLKNVDTGSQALTALSVTGDTTISSGNLLVGKTSSGFGTAGIELRSSDDASYFTRSGNAPVHINRLTSDGEIIRFNKDGSLVGAIASRAGSVSTIILDPSATGGGISGGGAALYPTDHAGTLSDGALTLGDASYRWNNLYLSGGAYLGGTGSANYLTDYEEGTWTPNLEFGGGSTGIGYNLQTGSYTKIGRMVNLHIAISLSSKGSSTGNATIANVPFTIADAVGGGTSLEASGIVGSYTSISNVYGNLTVVAQNTSNEIIIYRKASQLANLGTQLTHAEFGNTSAIRATITYQTT